MTQSYHPCLPIMLSMHSIVIDVFNSAMSIIGMVTQTSFSFNQSATCCGHIQKIVLQIGIGPIVGETSRAFALPSLFDIFADGCHDREAISTITHRYEKIKEYA